MSALPTSNGVNWAAIANILGGGLAAAGQPGGFGNFAGGAAQGAQNFRAAQESQEMMRLRKEAAERDKQRFDEEQRTRNQDRARQAEQDRLYGMVFNPQQGIPMQDAGDRRGEYETASWPEGSQDPDVLRELNSGYAGGGGTSTTSAANPLAGLNLTPQDRAYMALAGRAAGIDYLGKKLAAGQKSAEPHSAIAKAKADMNAGLIDQRMFDQIVADELRAPQGPATWADVKDDTGKVIGQRANTGELNYFSNNSNNPKPPSAADLRLEYTKSTKEYEQAAYGYSKVVQAANNPSGVGDIALIFGFMKTIDPTSTVREGEFATAQQTGGIPSQIVALYNKALNGERLTPAQRADFAQQAANQFKVYEDRKGVADDFYTGLAQRNQISPGDVLMPFPDLPTYNPPVTPDVGFSQQQGVVDWERGPDGKLRRKAGQ